MLYVCLVLFTKQNIYGFYRKKKIMIKKEVLAIGVIILALLIIFIGILLTPLESYWKLIVLGIVFFCGGV
jgi:hypothetical protein